ncbi:MAG: hypothetical protein J6S67_08145 [Methanobrevibacter sp.]|nr:hypothetical protein [Methanobrevibacter sp.]
MLSPTTRSMRVTYFDVVCVNPETQEIVTVHRHLLEWYYKTNEIMKKVTKKSLVSAPLLARRITNIAHVIEYRSMDANKFYQNSVLKKEGIYDERIKD